MGGVFVEDFVGGDKFWRRRWRQRRRWMVEFLGTMVKWKEEEKEEDGGDVLLWI